MSRYKTAIQIVLVAVLLLAGGMPAQARGVAGRNKAQVTRREMQETPTFWRWLKIKLTRYAMAAN